MQPCNFPSTGDSGNSEMVDAENVSVCKSSCELVTTTDLLETSYA